MTASCRGRRIALLLLCISVKFSSITASGTNNIVTYKIHENTDSFRNSAQHNGTGDIYVAGNNSLYVVNANLTLKHKGYVLENITTNINLVLLIDYESNLLITCGTFNEACQTRSLSNLNDRSSLTTSEVKIVRSGSNDSIAAFVRIVYNATAPGRSRSRLLMATISPSPVNAKNEYFAIISMRYITGTNAFNIERINDFQISVTDSYSLVSLNKNYLEQNSIRYVSAFPLGNFNYFFSTETNQTNSKAVISKIAQLCNTDETFAGAYVEMPILCNTSYDGDFQLKSATPVSLTSGDNNIFIVGLFHSRHLKSSVLCLYPLSIVRNRFGDNLKSCFNSSRNFDLHSKFARKFPLEGLCSNRSPSAISEDYCGEKKTLYSFPLIGNISLEKTALVNFSNVELTSVLGISVNSKTVLFIGTKNGNLIKVLVHNETYAEKYDTVQITDSTVAVSTKHISLDENYLYLLTEKALYRVPVETCERFTTCQSCLLSNDPYCGWCSLEARCSRSCRDSHLRDRWLFTQIETQCPTVENIPLVLMAGSPTNIMLSISKLPELSPGDKYQCSLGSNSSIFNTTLNVADQTLTCMSVTLPDVIGENGK